MLTISDINCLSKDDRSDDCVWPSLMSNQGYAELVTGLHSSRVNDVGKLLTGRIAGLTWLSQCLFIFSCPLRKRLWATIFSRGISIFLFLITNPVAFRTMGIVVSLPRIEGLVTVSSLSSATYPSSSMSGLASIGVTTTTIVNEHGKLS